MVTYKKVQLLFLHMFLNQNLKLFKELTILINNEKKKKKRKLDICFYV